MTRAHDRDCWQLPGVPPRLSDDIEFLVKYGCDINMLIDVEKRARKLKLPASTVLTTSGALSQDTYYRVVAQELGLEFVPDSPADPRPITQPVSFDGLHKLARVLPISKVRSSVEIDFGPREFHLAPDRNLLRLLKRHFKRSMQLKHRLKISSHSSNLQNLIERCSSSLLFNARNSLHSNLPQCSAKHVITVAQTIRIILTFQVTTVLWLKFDTFVPVLLHVIALLLYLGRAGLRFFAWKLLKTRKTLSLVTDFADEDLPIYSVLVALHDEAGVVEELVISLSKIDWPWEFLEIKLVCEADDRLTLEACHSVLKNNQYPMVSIVKVPACEPRTKPKALNYALQLCRGKFVVVYDAEDRPDPQQLRQAYEKFRAGPPNLACLQAPLVIENSGTNWLSRMFAIEYSALFDGLLPALGSKQLPLPLGGSSNHFKRTTLVHIGAWDPYNVTEDADLGLRLARAGCWAAVLSCPTFETAPTKLGVWLPQRTRWFKGWFQTWLVHTRQIRLLYQDLGVAGFINFQLMTLGTALSALTNPFLLYFVITAFLDIAQHSPPVWKQYLLVLDLISFAAGYGIYMLLAARTLRLRGMTAYKSMFWALPVYWVLTSVAAWRAIMQLFKCPHKWEKTPHTRRQSAD